MKMIFGEMGNTCDIFQDRLYLGLDFHQKKLCILMNKHDQCLRYALLLRKKLHISPPNLHKYKKLNVIYIYIYIYIYLETNRSKY